MLLTRILVCRRRSNSKSCSPPHHPPLPLPSCGSEPPAAAPVPKATYPFDDFSPLLFAQYDTGVGYVVFPTFAAAVDEYFWRYEAGRSVQASSKADDALALKSKKIEKEQVCGTPCCGLHRRPRHLEVLCHSKSLEGAHCDRG